MIFSATLQAGETVSLTLSQFKKARWICTEGRKVIISDTESLRALF